MVKIETIDPRRKLAIFETVDEAVTFCISQFISEARKAISLRSAFAVAFSGGSTPKKFYESLSTNKEALTLDWEKILLFWSDERAVAPDHPESNFGLAMQYLKKPPFDKAKAFRMPADSPDKEKAAREYEQLILTHCPDGRFDTVYLGVGEDGHTASLFAKTKALEAKERLVVPNYVDTKKSWRMTLTFSCINQARRIVVLAMGSSKAPILKQILDATVNADLPAKRVGTAASPALFIVDREATIK